MNNPRQEDKKQYILNATRQGSREFYFIALLIVFLNWISHLLIVDFGIINMFLYAFSIALLLLAYAKQTEPEHVMIISDKGFNYIHRYGQYFCPWEQVQRIDKATLNQGLNRVELGYIGIKLKNSQFLLEDFPLRLASRTLHEQRGLLMRLARSLPNSTNEILELLADKVSIKTQDKQVYSGLLAMFVNRCEVLDKHLGFHLYLPETSFKEATEAIIQRLNDVKNLHNHKVMTKLP